jgi:hypothetical protein
MHVQMEMPRHSRAPERDCAESSRSRHATIYGRDLQVPRELVTLLRLVCDTAALLIPNPSPR